MQKSESAVQRGMWMALIAAFLGWMFDGFEMGLFPLVAQPALRELLLAEGIDPSTAEGLIGRWIGVMTAGFLVGASTGGVLFGWLGDRMGRVRAMAASVLTYALFSGLCGFATEPWHLFLFRFLASLGMGGEWSLGVSLVMELWPSRSRAWLAGLIGAASNVGFVLVALLGLGLSHIQPWLESTLSGSFLPQELAARLTANSSWRLLMICGALPALLTFFIRLFVPESERWLEEKSRGSTRQWSSSDLLAVLGGTGAAVVMIYVWAAERPFGYAPLLAVKVLVTLIGLALAYHGYTMPVRKYLQRSEALAAGSLGEWTSPRVLRRMMIGAGLSGVALLGTWASIQNAPPWAGKLAEQQAAAEGVTDAAAVRAAATQARATTQIASGFGAIIGTIAAAFLGNWIGRRLSYVALCVGSLAASLIFFRLNSSFGPMFLVSALFAGGMTASFYGWLPLYLPELFPTRIRAFGQGFAFNFGRIIAAVGALQFGFLMDNVFDGSYPKACTVLSLVYVVGMGLIWLAPETHRQPLPE
ncbi:MAG: MFS transporter [Planctomyces sp.]|nr:MFS transporter [Planctomyces sp.]